MGAMFLQLWHQGAIDYGGDAETNPDFVALSPSGLSHPGAPFGRAATEAELDSLKASFVQGALDAEEIGADGVEIHAAHGFLLDQFLWPGTNLRTDRYGGPSITDRARFVAEVTEAVRAATGPDFVISVRFSQWKESDFDAKIVADSFPASEQLVTMLRAAGADIFHVSARRFWLPEWEGSDLSLAGWAKSFTDAAVVAVGSVGLDIDVMASLSGEEGGTRPAQPGSASSCAASGAATSTSSPSAAARSATRTGSRRWPTTGFPTSGGSALTTPRFRTTAGGGATAAEQVG